MFVFIFQVCLGAAMVPWIVWLIRDLRRQFRQERELEEEQHVREVVDRTLTALELDTRRMEEEVAKLTKSATDQEVHLREVHFRLEHLTHELWEQIPDWSPADTAYAGGYLMSGAQFAAKVEYDDLGKVQDWQQLPSNVCSDAEWHEIVKGPGSTWRLTQDFIDELDKVVDPIGTLKQRLLLTEYVGHRMNLAGAFDAGDKLLRDGYFKAGAIMQAYREEQEQRRHAAEYNALQEWMKEGSVRSDEFLDKHQQPIVVKRPPRPVLGPGTKPYRR